MSKSKEILTALLKEDLLEAKKLINDSLLEKLGNALEQKLVDFAPTVFESEAASEGLKGKQHKLDANKNGKIDGEDFKLLKKKKANEDVEESDEDMNSLVEEFQSELASLVQEIQEETGQELTEEEIEELANEYLDALSEAKDEDEDEEDEDEEDDCEDCKKSKKHKKD
jgi:hypothetical protein